MMPFVPAAAEGVDQCMFSLSTNSAYVTFPINILEALSIIHTQTGVHIYSPLSFFNGRKPLPEIQIFVFPEASPLIG